MRLKSNRIMIFGLLMIIISILYDIAFINIPYQDPTPELIVEQNRKYLIKNIMFYGGLIIVVAGVAGMIFRKKKSKKSL